MTRIERAQNEERQARESDCLESGLLSDRVGQAPERGWSG
jgi:hypothetical protein